MAFLDDMHMVSQPERVGSVNAVLQEALFTHIGIRVHGGKTQVWNMAGVRPASCDVLEQIVRMKIRVQWCGEVPGWTLVSKGSRSWESLWGITGQIPSE